MAVRKASKGEVAIRKFLIYNKIRYVREKRFKDLRSEFNQFLPYDFYVPRYKLLIEFDGEHHFKPIKYFGGQRTFERIQKLDEVKNEYVNNSKDLTLLRIPYELQNHIDEILTRHFRFLKYGI